MVSSTWAHARHRRSGHRRIQHLPFWTASQHNTHPNAPRRYKSVRVKVKVKMGHFPVGWNVSDMNQDKLLREIVTRNAHIKREQHIYITHSMVFYKWSRNGSRTIGVCPHWKSLKSLGSLKYIWILKRLPERGNWPHFLN